MVVKSKQESADIVPLEKLMTLPEFQCLNHSQMRFVIDYIGSGLMNGTYDAPAAAKFACGPEITNPNIRARQILNNRHVCRVLGIHFRVSPLERPELAYARCSASRIQKFLY